MLKEKWKLLYTKYHRITWSHKSYHLTILFVVVAMHHRKIYLCIRRELDRAKNIIIIMISKIKFCRKIHILFVSFLFRRFYDERYPGIFMTNHNNNFFYILCQFMEISSSHPNWITNFGILPCTIKRMVCWSCCCFFFSP